MAILILARSVVSVHPCRAAITSSLVRHRPSRSTANSLHLSDRPRYSFWWTHQHINRDEQGGRANLGLTWVKMTQNWTNLGLFMMSFLFRKLIIKSPRFVQFRADLTKFGATLLFLHKEMKRSYYVEMHWRRKHQR